MDFFKREGLEKTLEDMVEKLTRETSQNKETLSYIFDKILYLLSAGQPPIHLKEYLICPEIINKLLSCMPANIYMKKKEVELFIELSNKLNVNKTKYFYRFRILGSLGFYPDISFSYSNLDKYFKIWYKWYNTRI